MPAAHKERKIYAEVIVSSSDSYLLNSLYAALNPEAGSTPRYRTKISIVKTDPGTILIFLQSRDISSLRASLNTVLRALGVIFSASEVLLD